MSLYNNHTGSRAGKTARNTVIVVLLLLFALATLFPIYFMVISSFGDPVEAGAVSYSIWPGKFTLDSYSFSSTIASIRTGGF